MVTGGVRTVLLVVSLAAAASSRPPLCERPPFSVMRTMYKCTLKHMTEMPSTKALMSMETWPPTKVQILTFLQDFCTSSIPAGLTCFRDKISGCDAELQASFNQAAESGVGFLCQPSGRGFNPAIAAVFDGISEENVTNALDARRDVGCKFNDTRKQRRCSEQMEALPHPNSFSSLGELDPWMQRAAAQYFDCTIQLYRELKSTCSSWRLISLMEVEFLLLMPLLGVTLPYKTEELLEKFEM